jgi:nitrate/nitrite-specific signal transduction histidine kinase
VVLGLTALAFAELPAGDIGFGMAVAAGVWALGEAARNRHKVTLRARDGMLELDVVDDGAGTAEPSPGTGRGIAGMRERAAMLGGTLDAGPLPGGGFRVHAVLPLEAPR